MNILFIMVDQMRSDCMSAAGHPVVRTPTLDHLASQGVRFANAFVQSAVCGPSRMCFYTGRYVHAHRSTWNEVPLPIDEPTMGTYFRRAGYRAALCGKTHHVADYYAHPDAASPAAGEEILLSPLRDLEPYEFHDGHARGKAWQAYLRAKGYDDAVVEHPAMVQHPDGRRVRWQFETSHLPTVIAAEDSETVYLTDRAMQFMRETTDRPWFLHLSYYRPHQPTAAAAPYHTLYNPADVPAPNRHPDELKHPHPLHEPFRAERLGTALDQESVWRQMRATYYGLITQIDDELKRLFAFMDDNGIMDRTLIVFTSDHGDYMGDHWMFDKELFYDEAYRIPLIVYDPSVQANATRGSVEQAFVQAIDVLATMLDWARLPIDHAIQGRSLGPLLRGERVDDWPQAVYADWDFQYYWTAETLGLTPDQCRGWMIRDRTFKYWYFAALPDVLFDLAKDPRELHNVADDPGYRDTVRAYRDKLLSWRITTEDTSRSGWTATRRQRYGDNPFK